MLSMVDVLNHALRLTLALFIACYITLLTVKDDETGGGGGGGGGGAISHQIPEAPLKLTYGTSFSLSPSFSITSTATSSLE